MKKIDDTDDGVEEALAGFEKYQWEFYQDRMSELDELEKKREEADFFKFVADLAHKWKGFSAPYGFLKLEKLSIQLEHYAKTGDKSGIVDVVAKIKSYLADKKTTLEKTQ